MAQQLFLGTKIRRLRKQRQWTQAALAERLGISASYLNLIEHDKRSLTVPLLFKLADHFQVDVGGFAAEDEATLTTELHDAFADAVFAEHALSKDDLRDMARHAPSASRAVLGLYRRYRALRDEAQGMASRMFDSSVVGEIDTHLPPDEVTELLQEHDNHFPALEGAADRLWREAGLSTDELERGLVEHLRLAHDVKVEIAAGGDRGGATRVFDRGSRTLTLSELLPYESRVFQLAHQIGLLSLAGEIDRLLADGALTTPESRALGRIALANAFAGAVLMPYDRIHDAAREMRYDVERLQARFRASFEQVCHRLTALNRPGKLGVPLHFVRIDIAGNISKRFSGSGIRFSRYSGACPRWNVHTAFLTPDRICVQISRMPDGATYFCIARTARKGGGGHHVPQSHLAIGLGCRIDHAKELVYSDGIDLDNPDAAVPIGVSCRICERTDCGQRAFPALHRRLEIDPDRRGVSFYTSPEKPPQ